MLDMVTVVSASAKPRTQGQGIQWAQQPKQTHTSRHLIQTLVRHVRTQRQPRHGGQRRDGHPCDEECDCRDLLGCFCFK